MELIVPSSNVWSYCELESTYNMGFDQALQLHLPHWSSYSLDLYNFFVNLLIFPKELNILMCYLIGEIKNIIYT